MITELIHEFYVIGITVRTSNENGQSAIDIPKLWETFINENIIDQIPNKLKKFMARRHKTLNRRKLKFISP